MENEIVEVSFLLTTIVGVGRDTSETFRFNSLLLIDEVNLLPKKTFLFDESSQWNHSESRCHSLFSFFIIEQFELNIPLYTQKKIQMQWNFINFHSIKILTFLFRRKHFSDSSNATKSVKQISSIKFNGIDSFFSFHEYQLILGLVFVSSLFSCFARFQLCLDCHKFFSISSLRHFYFLSQRAAAATWFC